MPFLIYFIKNDFKRKKIMLNLAVTLQTLILWIVYRLIKIFNIKEFMKLLEKYRKSFTHSERLILCNVI